MSDDIFEEALCAKPRYSYLDWFSEDPEEQSQCKRICNQCPIKKECAQYAMENQELWGIWGGTDDFRRRRAFGVDEFGEKRVGLSDLVCPFCNSDEVNIKKKREYKGYRCVCANCSIKWYTHRYPMKMRKILKRRQDKSVNENMESGVDEA